MYEVRPSTLKQIEGLLERSYFTAASFSISNAPSGQPFLTIEFIPKPTFKFEVYPNDDDEGFTTKESPGEHISTGELFERGGFSNIIYAIETWIRRICDDFDCRKPEDGEAENYIESLREKIFSDTSDGEYTPSEIDELKSKLNNLRDIVERQAEQLEASEHQIKQFKKEIDNIKNDLEVMPKGIWNKVAGNKLLKSMGGFLKTAEGRKLISDGIRKLIE